VEYDDTVWDSVNDGDLELPVKVEMTGQFEAGQCSFGVDNSGFTYESTFKMFQGVKVWMSEWNVWDNLAFFLSAEEGGGSTVHDESWNELNGSMSGAARLSGCRAEPQRMIM
jgi:hypothetical protein